MAVKTEIASSLRQLHLPAFVDNYGVQATVATNEGWAYDRYLVALCELELEERRQRKTERLLRESKLPREKTWAAFEQSRLPRTVERRVDVLLEGDFLDRTENVLAFGNPGSGKTHLLCALGHELILKGRRIYFTPCALLVQRLLRAKAELELEKELKRLDSSTRLLTTSVTSRPREMAGCSDSGSPVRCAEHSDHIEPGSSRTGTRSSGSAMTTAAAIDRIVHHSVILELNLSSYRMEAAKNAK